MNTETDIIAKVKDKLFESSQYIGKDVLRESVRALHSTLECTECSLWSINHNSTRGDFISTSLIWRECNVSYAFPHENDYVHDLNIGLFKAAINAEKPYSDLTQKEAIDCGHRSREFIEAAGLNRFIVYPIFTDKSDTVNALLEISYKDCTLKSSFWQTLSRIIHPFFSASIQRDFFFQKQTLMDNLITRHRKHKDKEISVLFKEIIHGVLLKACPSEGVSLFLWDNYQNRYNLAATTGLEKDPNPMDVYYQKGEGRTGQIGITGNSVITDFLNKEDEENKSRGKYCEKINHDARTEIFIPIKDPSQTNDVIGIFRLVNKKNVYNNSIIDFFNDSDVKLMEDAAEYLALIIANYWKEESQYDFIDKLTHEITTPANAIWKTASRLYTHISEQEFLDRNLSPYLKNIIDFAEIQRWQASTNLFLSKNRRKQPFNVRYSITPTRLNDVIKNGINIAIPIARKYNVQFSNILINPESDPLLTINIDGDAFVTVFYNLFTNAIKYHDPNEQFSIETSYNMDNENLVIKVADNGIGINHKEQEIIFEKGYRSKSAIRMNASGYGIGLTVVKQIVEDFGGSIEITNNRKPTTFQITIPNNRIQQQWKKKRKHRTTIKPNYTNK